MSPSVPVSDDNLQRNAEEIQRAAEEVRSVVAGWEMWLLAYGRGIESSPDYGRGHDGNPPLAAIDGMTYARHLEQRLEHALQALYHHRVLPPTLRGRSCEEAAALFPAFPTGAMDSGRDKELVTHVRRALPALIELERELGHWVDQLALYPRSVIHAVADEQAAGGRQGAVDAPEMRDASDAAPAPKRSTERGEARAKLIAALTKHHKYADGGALHQEPIPVNQLARTAEVAPATASAFFQAEFLGHAKYRLACQDAAKLAAALRLLNGEFSPHHLYGRRPAGEDDRDDE
jgi:hypothetical protein